ncbi:MAG TPA: amidase family protein [Steroidobacteraceae bacterium]
MKRLLLLGLLALPGTGSPMAAGAAPFDPAYADIAALRCALDSRRITSEQLLRYYLGRIERFDKQGPRINALITLNPHALEQARNADAHPLPAGTRNLLYGIPFIVKDNYDTAGIPTSGGSAALEGSVPSANAFVVQRLLDRGAILIGKANMSELAASYGRLGYSSAGGLTVNPYNTARDVSGSSSGSAAAVAADFAPFALGTDTTGSIRGPASVAGLVGLRPTLGLTSRSGVIPLSLSFDTAGILTRTVADQAIVLEAIAAPDPDDASTARASTRASTTDAPTATARYREALDAEALRGARLGVVRNFRGGNAEVDALEQSALRTLEARGAVLVPIDLPEEFERLWDLVVGPAGTAEFKPQFERYLRALPPGQPRTLAELIEISASPAVMNSANPVNPLRLQALREADSTQLTDSPAYIRILTDIIPSLRRQLETLASRHRLRAFVFSTMSCPASARFDRPDPTYVCHSEDPYKASYIAAATGFPEVTVPVDRVSANIPVGYSFLGLPYTESTLLSFAYAFQIARPRLPPPPLD